MPTDATAILIGGIKCWDEDIRGRGNRDNGAAIQRKIRCRWRDWKNLVDFLMGSAPTVANGVTTTHPAQLLPGTTNLYFNEWELEGDGFLAADGNNLVAPEFAILTGTYSSTTFSFDAQDLTTSQIDFGEEVFSPPISALKFSGGSALPSAPAIIVPVVYLTIVRRNLLSLNVAPYINATLNPLNSVGVVFPNFTVGSAKQVKFGGASSTFRATTSGYFFDVATKFAARSTPWDQVMDFDGVFKTVQRADGSALLGSSDLNALLR